MGKKYKSYSAALKKQIALAALNGQQTINEIASEFGVHPNQVTAWKKQAIEGMEDTFSSRRCKDAVDTEELQNRLYQEIGQLKMELDWMKKKSGQFRG